MKPIRAWMVASVIDGAPNIDSAKIKRTRERARRELMWPDERLITVEIREIKPKRRKAVAGE